MTFLLISKNYLNVTSIKYSNGTAIFTSFFLPPFGMVPIKYDLYLEDEELSVLTSENSPLFPLAVRLFKLP